MSRLLPNLALSLALAACSSIDARTDFDPAVDFTSYSTFAMAPLPEKGPSHMPRYTKKRAETIREEIAAGLTAKGLERVEGPAADLVVSFTVDARRQTADQVSRYDEGGLLPQSSTETSDVWFSTGWDSGVQVEHYVEGTLLIDVFDPDLEKVIWHGWATVDIFRDREVNKKARRAIEKLLRRFPPR